MANDGPPAALSAVTGDSASSRRAVVIATVVVGLVLLAAIAGAVLFVAKKSADDAAVQQAVQASADAAAAQMVAQEQVLKTAADDCNIAYNEGVTIGDGGRTVTLDGKGAEDSSGLALEDMVCVLVAIHTPDVVISKLDTTRALDGRQSAKWDNIEASWTYHPDAGLEIILTTATIG